MMELLSIITISSLIIALVILFVISLLINILMVKRYESQSLKEDFVKKFFNILLLKRKEFEKIELDSFLKYTKNFIHSNDNFSRKEYLEINRFLDKDLVDYLNGENDSLDIEKYKTLITK